MKDLIPLVLAGMALSASTSNASASPSRPARSAAVTPAPGVGVRRYQGVYVFPSMIAPDAGNQIPPATYISSAVNGVVLLMPWKQIEPSPGRYDWTAFDAVASVAIARGKRLSVGVAAGFSTPAWLYAAPYDVGSVSYQLEKHRGCQLNTVPTPWSTNFATRYVSIVKAMADHLRTMPGGYESVAMAKLAAINGLSGEMRFYHKLGSPRAASGSCPPTDTLPLWRAAGYRPALATRSWLAIAKAVAAIYPGRELSQDILENPIASAPTIDDDGNFFRRATAPAGFVPFVTQVTAAGAATFGRGISFQWNGLSDQNNAATLMTAKQQGAAIGWQMNERSGRGGAICGPRINDGIPCTNATYAAIFANGLALGGTTMEVHPPDVVAYPSETAAGALAFSAAGR